MSATASITSFVVLTILSISILEWARSKFSGGREFAKVCEHALSQARESKQIYDAILVDEAQDLSPAFLRLCYELLKAPKRLVYAYDELQSLSGESLPSPEEIFGNNADGLPKVRFDDVNSNEPQRDIILAKCYRNSRPVLVTAHALGFGIYRQSRRPSQTGTYPNVRPSAAMGRDWLSTARRRVERRLVYNPR